MKAREIVVDSGYKIDQDLKVIDALFWEYDAMRCGSKSGSERDAFMEILFKYGNYLASEIDKGNISVKKIKCIDRKAKCFSCSLPCEIKS